MKVIIAAILFFSFSASAKEIIFKTNNVCIIDQQIDSNSVRQAKLCLADKVIQRRGRKYPIYLYLNSPGGSIFAGLKFIEFAKTIDNLHTVTSYSASMAAAIVEHLPGKRYITETGIMMFHRARGKVAGQIESGELERRLRFWKRIIRKSERVQAKRIGITLKKYKENVHDEWWLFGSQAVEEKVCDEVIVVKCSTALSKKFVKIKTPGIFGGNTVEVSACPMLR